MCSLCEDCICSKFQRGSVRGIMDADPDEYWCSANEDEYYYTDDDEIIANLRSEYADEMMAQGCTEEEAERLADEMDFDVECPSYSYYDPYDDYYPDDGPYDTIKERDGLA